jgi:hypothetical protein
MILTHFLALFASPTLLITPSAAAMPLNSSQPAVSSIGHDQPLAPALKVRAAPAVLPVRER